jgi:hypothetical protein
MKKLTKKEVAAADAKKEQVAKIFKETQKNGPGHITSVDIARLLGMPEKEIADLFGEDKRSASSNKTGSGQEYNEGNNDNSRDLSDTTEHNK